MERRAAAKARVDSTEEAAGPAAKRVRVRLPAGPPLARAFREGDAISVVRDFVDASGRAPRNFALVYAGPPKRTLGDDDAPLSSLGPGPVALMVADLDARPAHRPPPPPGRRHARATSPSLEDAPRLLDVVEVVVGVAEGERVPGRAPALGRPAPYFQRPEPGRRGADAEVELDAQLHREPDDVGPEDARRPPRHDLRGRRISLTQRTACFPRAGSDGRVALGPVQTHRLEDEEADREEHEGQHDGVAERLEGLLRASENRFPLAARAARSARTGTPTKTTGAPPGLGEARRCRRPLFARCARSCSATSRAARRAPRHPPPRSRRPAGRARREDAPRCGHTGGPGPVSKRGPGGCSSRRTKSPRGSRAGTAKTT